MAAEQRAVPFQDTYVGDAIFMSCQRTSSALSTLRHVVEHHDLNDGTPLRALAERGHNVGFGCVYCSLPQFNRPKPNAEAQWAALSIPFLRVVEMDVPVYTAGVKTAVVDMLRAPVFEKALRDARCQPLVPCIDMGLRQHIDPEHRNGLHVTYSALEAHGAKEVADRVRAFVGAFCKLGAGDIRTEHDWHSFVASFLVPGATMTDNTLHVFRVLTLFGASSDTATSVATDVARIEGKAAPGDSKLRFLSKALTSFGVPGCLTDAVHMVLALRGLPANGQGYHKSPGVYRGPGDERLAELLRDFANPSTWPRFPDMRLSHAITDHETDDRLAVAILMAVSEASHLRMPRVFLQCAPAAVLVVRAHLPPRHEVVVDDESTNAQKVLAAEPV